MSECQSKCACGDICRRVDEHLQHQCPKCNYEQRGTAENVAATPATPAATPMAGNGYETAAVMRDLFREWWDKHDTATKLRTPQEMTAFQRIQNAFYAGALAIMDRQRAVAMNSEAPQKLPAAAQPQRESEVQSIFTVEQVRDALIASSPQGFDLSKCGVNEHILVDELNERLPLAAQREGEQPEQALRNLARSWLIRYDRDEVELTEDSLIDLMRRAALSPQADSQETP